MSVHCQYGQGFFTGDVQTPWYGSTMVIIVCICPKNICTFHHNINSSCVVCANISFWHFQLSIHNGQSFRPMINTFPVILFRVWGYNYFVSVLADLADFLIALISIFSLFWRETINGKILVCILLKRSCVETLTTNLQPKMDYYMYHGL